MQKLSLEQLREKAKEYFDFHPTVDVFLCTDDAMFFLTEHKNSCELHAKEIESEIFTIERPVSKESKKS
jgi:hypothetical protein